MSKKTYISNDIVFTFFFETSNSLSNWESKLRYPNSGYTDKWQQKDHYARYSFFSL